MKAIGLLGLLATISAPTVFANNLTISDFFPAGGPEMTASPVSCGQVSNQAYLQAGTISVSSTGDFEIADSGNLLGFTGTGQGIVDIVINIYENSFDPADPGLNRIAIIDEGSTATLESGKNYLLVIQAYCENISGVFGIVLRGSGTITGAGFESDSHTIGQHAPSDPTATFPDGIGTHGYDLSSLVSVPSTGIYYFGEVGLNFNADVTLLAYENSFDPNNTGTNLAGWVSQTGSLSLSKDKLYVFVAVDANDLEGNWQYTLFPPGPARFNESMKGAWITPGVDGAGVMMEIGSKSGVLFFAWFTFPDAPVVQLASKTPMNPEPSADIGSSDQRWLTGFGPIHALSSTVDIRYENTTGGIFNATLPKPVTDSNYGFGTAQVTDCNNINISYDLPGGVVGTASMIRALNDGVNDCLEAVNADPIVQSQ